MKKLCVVVQRYGLEINGGAEDYCRIYCEQLNSRFELEVVTSCAADYVDWANYYDEGVADVNGVAVRRFPVLKPRSEDFGQLCEEIYANRTHTVSDGYNWVEAQGPYCPGLVDYLRENHDGFDVFLFMTYLYYPTVFGLREVADKSVLIPFAHDEPTIYIAAFREVFTSPAGIIFNTPEERSFVHGLFHNEKIPSIMTGIAVDIPESSDRHTAPPVDTPYILYMGRIDVFKGCDKLFEYFDSFKKRMAKQGKPCDLTLVLTGKEFMPVPKRSDIISLGFVSEEEKYDVLSGCELLVLPSLYESLSIVVLDAMAHSKPVLVNGSCEVLKGHCLRSEGGLYFTDEDYFCECLELLMDNPSLRDGMGRNGRRYVMKNYRRHTLLERTVSFLNRISDTADS